MEYDKLFIHEIRFRMDSLQRLIVFAELPVGDSNGFIFISNSISCAYKMCYTKKDGIVHRIDGPAVICNDGDLEWYQNGKVHREDGPALMLKSEPYHWVLNDIEYTKEEWFSLLTEEQLAIALSNPENF